MSEFTDWDSVLCHHGVKGQKWGVRRYQNEDGSYTQEGVERYSKSRYGIQKALNQLDMVYADRAAQLKAAKARKKASYDQLLKQDNKLAALQYNGKTQSKISKKAQKISKRGEKAFNKMLKSDSDIKNITNKMSVIESNQWKLIGAASLKGFNVTAKPVKRIGQDGYAAVASLLGSVGSIPYNLITKGKHIEVIEGHEFKVKR